MTPNAEIRAEYSLQPFHHSQARTRFRREHCLDHFHSAQLRPQNTLDCADPLENWKSAFRIIPRF